MSKAIIISTCLGCPFYETENNVYRRGYVGQVARCKIQGNKEIEFTDKMDSPETFSKIHQSCPLPNY